MGSSVRDELESNDDLLRNTIENHIVEGITPEELIPVGNSVLTSLYGNDLAISKQGNNMQVNGHRIETADLLAYNGLVHIINGVLLTTTNVGGGGNTVSELIGAPNAVTSTEKAAQDTSSGFNPMCTRNLAYNMALVSVLVSCLLLL